MRLRAWVLILHLTSHFYYVKACILYLGHWVNEKAESMKACILRAPHISSMTKLSIGMKPTCPFLPQLYVVIKGVCLNM
jgi:hypothetical protein